MRHGRFSPASHVIRRLQGDKGRSPAATLSSPGNGKSYRGMPFDSEYIGVLKLIASVTTAPAHEVVRADQLTKVLGVKAKARGELTGGYGGRRSFSTVVGRSRYPRRPGVLNLNRK